MSFEEEFDRIIRQKMEGNKVPFSEGDWQKASDLIEKDKLSSSVISSTKRFYKMGAITFVITALTTISFLVVKDPSIEKELVSDKKETQKVIQQKSQQTLAHNSIKEVHIAKGPSKSELSDKIAATSMSGAISSKAESTAFPVSKKNPNSKNSIVQKTTEPSSELKQTTGNTKKPFIVAAAVPNDKEESEEKPEINSEIESYDAGSSSISESTPIERLNQQPTDFRYHLNEPELIPQNGFSKRLKEEDYYKKGASKLSHFLLMEGGVNYHFGWTDLNGTDGKGLNWYAGLTYGCNFNKHLGVSIGMQAYTVEHIQTPFYTSSQKVYSFGSAQSQTVLTCNSLLYAALPLKIHYTTSSNWRFSAGVNAGVVVEAKNTVQTIQLSDGVLVASETHTESGLYSGLNTTSFLLCASVNKEITNRVEFQAEFNYGLSDLFENTSSNTNKQLGNSIRLGLNYRLFTR